MSAKFELFKDTAGQFRFQLKAANDEIIAASQGYTSKAAAQNGIVSSMRTRQRPHRGPDLTRAPPRPNAGDSEPRTPGYSCTTLRAGSWTR
jgi:uncharacterized protein YegP (UPF0339 family)